jgi:hypothetical protein
MRFLPLYKFYRCLTKAPCFDTICFIKEGESVISQKGKTKKQRVGGSKYGKSKR